MNALPQLTDVQARLDNALKLGLVKKGTRFLYTINGSGKCYEGTLLDQSPGGHVKLENSGVWHWPPEVRIEELLAPASPPIPGPSPVAISPAGDAAEAGAREPFRMPFAKTTTPKSKSK